MSVRTASSGRGECGLMTGNRLRSVRGWPADMVGDGCCGRL